MVVVEYRENAEDHRSILLLLQQVGSRMTPKSFSKMYERISKIQLHRISSQNRSIHLRYKKFYLPASSEWGEFQAHRKVLGLISLAQCDKVEELPDLYKLYDGVKEQYGSTLFDSRLVIFGIDPKKGGSKTSTPDLTRKGIGVMSLPKDEQKVNGTDSKNGNLKERKDPTGDFKQKETAKKSEEAEEVSNNNIVCDNTEVQNVEGDALSISNSSVGKDSGKGDSLDSRNSLESHPLEIVGEDSPSTTDSDNDCQSNGLEAEPTDKDNNHTNSTLELPDITKPRSSSMLSQDSSSSTSSFVKDAPPHVIFYPGTDTCVDLEDKVADFIDSLFWVLESKRLDRSQEKLDRLTMLAAPFEKKDLIGVDTEGRMYRKRCQGRLKKQQGDLCLLAGLSGEAIMYYQTAIDMLKSANDWLWLGAAQEGLCSAYVITALPKIDSSASLTRNHSFSLKRGTNAVKEASRMATGTVRGAPSGLDLYEGKPRLPQDIGDKYKEAVSNYCKFKNAAVIELECSIKACRVLAGQQKYLEASEFLQNVVYINIPLTEEEKIERYNTLSNLYLLIGMKRKAGFFHRIAAMQCVAPNNPKPAWNTCYYILLQALSGYRISLDPKDTPIDHVEGWPATQLRVLHELIYSSRKMGNPAIAIRHITYLFHTLFDYLSREERIELVSILRSYTSRCEGGAQTLALDNGLILPPVPFYKFPRVYSFKPVCPPEHLLPCKYQKKKCSSISQLSTSPFIYSPIQNTSSAKVNSQVSEMDFHWVEGEKCAVEVEAQNPLPIPLDVNDIDLLTEGATFKGEPCNITVPGHARVRFNITGTVPQKSTLSIMGYLTTVFGCRSRCRFRDMHYLDQTQFNVKVVPRLPEMSLTLVPERKEVLTSSLMKHGSVTSVAFSVYSGQSCEFEVRLNNAGQIPVDMVDIELHSSSHKDMLKDIVLWNQFNVNSQLPVTPGGHASFTLYINTEHVTSQTTAVDQMLSGKLVFQYSDVGGLESGFCRQCCLMFTLHIQPVVLVKDVQVKQSKRNGSEFCLELLLENCVTQDIIIASQPDTAVPISSLSQARVSFHVKKYQLPLENLKEVELTEDSAVANENQSFNSTVRMSQSQLESQSGRIKLDQSLNSPEDELSILTNEIAQHLKNLLDIRWNIPDKNCEGKMQLNCTKWDTELLESLVTGPLSFDIEVNGSPHEQVSEVKVRSGDSVVIKCCAINTSDCDINDVKLTLHSEAFNPASEVSHSSCLVLGQTSSHQSSIPPKASVVLDWQVLYFCPGLYEVEVSVTGFTNSLSLFTGCIKDRLGEKQWTSVPVIVKVEE